MSAPEPDMDRQVKRHKGPLLGFIAILVFVSVLIVWWLGQEIDAAPSPEATPTSAPEQGGQTGGIDPADQGVSTTPARNPAAEGATDVNPSGQQNAPIAD